jgi:hypothetical protein
MVQRTGLQPGRWGGQRPATGGGIRQVQGPQARLPGLCYSYYRKQACFVWDGDSVSRLVLEPGPRRESIRWLEMGGVFWLSELK